MTTTLADLEEARATLAGVKATRWGDKRAEAEAVNRARGARARVEAAYLRDNGFVLRKDDK